MSRAVIALLAVLAACGTTRSDGYQDHVAGGLIVRVVDARTGAPVPGAEVVAASNTLDGPATAEQPAIHDFLFAGSLGQLEAWGYRWLCDAQGEARIPEDARGQPILARKGELWGCLLTPTLELWKDPGAVTIAVEPDESIRVVCTDPEGHGGLGALFGVQTFGNDPANADGGQPIGWGTRVSSPDGMVTLPHVQFWRARVEQGLDIRIHCLGLWSDEMLNNEGSRAFPAERVAELRMPVSASGSIVITAPPATEPVMATLRWLDPPPDPADPDDVPEFPIGLAQSGQVSEFAGVPLGHRFEIVLSLPGWIDPRVTFDGPKTCGERVAVELAATKRTARVTGVLVDEQDEPLAGHSFDAWIEQDDERFAAEEDWCATDEYGRFELDFAPIGESLAVVFEVHGEPGVRFIGRTEVRLGRREFSSGLDVGENDLGAVKCARPAADGTGTR